MIRTAAIILTGISLKYAEMKFGIPIIILGGVSLVLELVKMGMDTMKGIMDLTEATK